MSVDEPPGSASEECVPTDNGGGPDAAPDLARMALARVRAGARGVAGTRSNRGGPRQRRGQGPTTLSGPGPHPRDPQRLGAAVRDLLGDRGWEPTVAAASVVGRWESLVGPEVAAHCRPERLDDGVLTLVAESTAWATQLRLLAGRIVGRVTVELGPDVVRTVRVHGPTTPSWRHGPWRVTGGRGPRDTYG